METAVLGLFAAALVLCISLDWSILYALFAGFLLFCAYGYHKGFSLKELMGFALKGIKTVKHILIIFLMIGLMTALWREAGTIAVIVSFLSGFIHPSVFLFLTFLFNMLVSFLTGTSFGTAATMGVICASIGNALGVSPVFMGGAVLAGAFFGDRCSFVSTSAYLVATVTGTDLYQNVKNMVRSGFLPFFVASILYLALGLGFHGEGSTPDLYALFEGAFQMSPVAVLPALVVLVLALMRFNVAIAMGGSILSALPVCLFLQHTDPLLLPRILLFGYESTDPSVAALLNGGGLLSMLRVTAIVCISSSYSDLFRKTGLLDGIRDRIDNFGKKRGRMVSITATSVFTSMIACNQTLAILLTNQLCQKDGEEKEAFALSLEDSVVVISPLIPWSIACAVPLSAVNAPPESIFFAFFLWLLPIFGIFREKGFLKHQERRNPS